MKKLIAVITLLFAFTVSANAQDKKAAPVATAAAAVEGSTDAAAKKDVAALMAKVTISESFKNDMLTLMKMKYDALANPKLTAAEKQAVSERIEKKILSGLTPEQSKQLSADPELLKKLTH